MAYSRALAEKGINRRDARMAAKGCESAAVTSSLGSISINQAVGSVAVQG
mgnify:CR=1